MDTNTSPQKHRYDAHEFAFSNLFHDALSVDGVSLIDASTNQNSDVLNAAAGQLSKLRSNAMDVLHSDDFQALLETFSHNLAAEHFGAPCYFQKVPSIRLFMPEALGTSWHTDNWYGHAKQSRTFWVPLTPVPTGAGVQFVDNPEILHQLEQELGKSLGLSDINRICQNEAIEFTAQPGEYLSFSARTLHGSVHNHSGCFRCSIDFRGTTVEAGVGNKPLSNYRTIDHEHSYNAVASHETTAAVKYINGAGGVSTKYQHILLEAYAQENGLDIVRNEAEIESIPARPVLSAYACRDVPQSDNYDHLLVYSMQCLPSDRKLAHALLEDCAVRGITLHFALEDAIFPTTADITACLQPDQSIVA